MCPCYQGRVGVFALAFAAGMGICCEALFGVTATAVFRAAVAGSFSSGMVLWTGVVVVGLWQLAVGLYAAFSHDDDISWGSLAWSVCMVGLVFWLVSPFDISEPWTKAVLWAFVASEIFNIWQQLRGGVSGGRVPIYTPPPPQPSITVTTRRIQIDEKIVSGGLGAWAAARDVSVADARYEAPELPQPRQGELLPPDGTRNVKVLPPDKKRVC